MSIVYWLVLALLILLIYRYDIKEEVVNRDFWFRFVLVSLILISGLRYRVGADTINYIYCFYHEIPYIWELSNDESGFEPLFVLMNSIVKTLGGRFYIVQLLQALFVNGLVLAYIRKHSKYLFTCIFVYCFYCYFYYNYEEMRASMSIALYLYGNDYFLEKKWGKGMLLYLIGMLFHYSTALLFITPLFLFLKFNIIGYVVLVSSCIVGYVIQKEFGDFIMFIDLEGDVGKKAEMYANNEKLFDQHLTLFNILLHKVSLIIYSIGAYYYIKYVSKQDDLYILKFQPLVIVGLIFVLFSIPMPISYRFIRFYNVYFIFFYVHLFMDIVKNNLPEMKSVSWVRSLVLFLPFFHVVGSDYRAEYSHSDWSHKVYGYCRFYPYSSVIEKSTDDEREFFYKNWHLGKIVDKDEY